VLVLIAAAAATAHGIAATRETNDLRTLAIEKEQKLAALQEEAKKPVAMGGDGSAALEAEIAGLRAYAQSVDLLVQRIQSSGPSAKSGFSKQIGLLTAAAQDDVWIVDADVTAGGAGMSIMGKAMKNESVVRYTKRLNDVYRPYGVKFKSIELAPEPPAIPGAPAVVSFKVS
jgi:hypothetical protein